MAWIDDRIWCHPKLADLSPAAWKLYVCGNAYCSGFGTRGFLTPGQQQQIGSTTRTRRELVDATLWDLQPDGRTILVHDWEDHNGKRDDARRADRDRKRAERAAKKGKASRGLSDGQRPGRSDGASDRPAYVEGSEGSEGLKAAAASTTSGQDPSPTAAAELHQHLDKLGVNGGLRVAAFADVDRALACANEARRRGDRNPAGLFRTMFEAGEHPAVPPSGRRPYDTPTDPMATVQRMIENRAIATIEDLEAECRGLSITDPSLLVELLHRVQDGVPA